MLFPACLYSWVLLLTDSALWKHSSPSSFQPINLQHSHGVSFLILYVLIILYTS